MKKKIASQEGQWPMEIKSGSAVVKIYRTEKASGYVSYTLVYYKGRERKFQFLQDLAEAKKEAKRLADEIAQGEQASLDWTASDRLAIQRALESLAALKVPIDVAAGRYAEAHQILAGSGGTLTDAAREYVKQHAGVIRKSVPEVVELYLAQVKAAGKSDEHRRHVTAALNRFAEAFEMETHLLTPAVMADYLTKLPFGQRTKKNHRNMLAHFAKWLQVRNYLPKGTNLMDGVDKYKNLEGEEVSVFTAEEMTRLLAAADEKILPFLLLAGFAGIRHAEIDRLEWKDIDLEEGFIEIAGRKSKTKVRRIVPIKPNLRAWLKTLGKREGKIISFTNIGKHLERVAAATADSKKELAAVPWKRNALRHTYISARVAECSDKAKVADEAGNSPQIITTNYLKRLRPAAATAWFGIMPPVKEPEAVVVLPAPVIPAIERDLADAA